jgi:hypothetical protein
MSLMTGYGAGRISRAWPKVPQLTPVRDYDIVGSVERFLAYLARNEDKHPSTVAEYRRCIVSHALPYFVHVNGCKTLASFSSHSKGPSRHG